MDDYNALFSFEKTQHIKRQERKIRYPFSQSESHTDHQAGIEEPVTSLLSTHQMKKREANVSSVSLKCSHGEHSLFIGILTIYSKEYFPYKSTKFLF